MMKVESAMEDLARSIAAKVVEDTKYFTAIIGLVGVIVGSVLTIVGNVVIHFLGERSEAKKDKPRKELLLTMLEDRRFRNRWRKLDRLMHVIGADDETTKRLLLEVGARSSEDKQDLWGLVKYHPLGKKAKLKG